MRNRAQALRRRAGEACGLAAMWVAAVRKVVVKAGARAEVVPDWRRAVMSGATSR